MGESVVVIMIKNESTGFLEKELTSCLIGQWDEYMFGAYAEETEGGVMVHLKIQAPGDYTDDEYNFIYDNYDGDIFNNDADWGEVDGYYYPAWELVFPYDEKGIAGTIEKLLNIHVNEITEILRLMK